MFETIDSSKRRLYINTGALMDIPTANFVVGPKGETVINGGLGPSTLIVGRSNSFKSTLAHYIQLSAVACILLTAPTNALTYDTEITVEPTRLEHLASFHDNMPFNVINQGGNDGFWKITDKANYSADEWFSLLKKELLDKENSKKRINYTSFLDDSGKGPFKDQAPKFVEIDSYSEFEPEATIELLEKSMKEDGSSNTLFMKQGAYKTKVSSMLNRIANKSNTYFILTAHIGDEIVIPTGPLTLAPTKKLGFLKTGDKIKGVSDKTLFLMSNAWYAHSAKPLVSKADRKLPEYPFTGEEDTPETDLSILYITQLRGKNGGSGYTLPIVVSQIDGVMPSLTEFHYLREFCKYYGMSGSNINYSLDLLPDLKLTRPTVRQKIDENADLRRALNITAELKQLHVFHPQLARKGLLCTPKELYDDLIKLGYDWKVLLNTRGWWTPDNHNTEVPYLSTLDLLKMRKGEYKPFWMDDEKGKK